MSTNANANTTSIRVPPNIKGLVHPEVEQAIYNHDGQIGDLYSANSVLTSQLQELQKQIAAMGKK